MRSMLVTDAGGHWDQAMGGMPPITINITLPDLAQALERFATPDGEALRTRDGVSPRPC